MFTPHRQLKTLQHIKLDSDAKEDMRQHLLSYMKENPARTTDDGSRHLLPKQQHRLFPFMLNLQQSMSTMALMIIAMLAGGTVFAAQEAIPGDPLYPIKLHVNEQIEAALTTDEEDAANLELTLAERRVDEAVRAEAQGRLNTETNEQIEEAVTQHIAHTHKLAEALEVQGNAQAAAAIRLHLDRYLEIKTRQLADLGVTTVSESDIDPNIRANPVLSNIRTENKERLNHLSEIVHTNSSVNLGI